MKKIRVNNSFPSARCTRRVYRTVAIIKESLVEPVGSRVSPQQITNARHIRHWGRSRKPEGNLRNKQYIYSAVCPRIVGSFVMTTFRSEPLILLFICTYIRWEEKNLLAGLRCVRASRRDVHRYTQRASTRAEAPGAYPWICGHRPYRAPPTYETYLVAREPFTSDSRPIRSRTERG